MNPVQRCARRFAEIHSDDAARLLELSPAAEGAPFLSLLPPAVAARLLSQMSLAAGAETFSLMDQQAAAELTNQLPFDSAVSLLRRLDTDRRAGVMAVLPQEPREHLERLLEYPDGTVGAVTDPQVLEIPIDFTVEEAQRLLKKRVGVVHHQLYVVDSGRRLLGYLHVRELLRAHGKASVTSIMLPAPVCLPADARLASTLHHRAWNRLDAIPVVDAAGVLLGIFRHRQLRQLQSAQQPGGVASAIVGLSELYWIGLAKFLAGGVGQPESSHGTAEPHEGGQHAR